MTLRLSIQQNYNILLKPKESMLTLAQKTTIQIAYKTWYDEQRRRYNCLIDFDDGSDRIMNQYESIDIYGNGNSMLEALSFQHKMTRVGRNVNIFVRLEGEQIFLAYNSSSSHLAMILHSGETAEIIRIGCDIKREGDKDDCNHFSRR